MVLKHWRYFFDDCPQAILQLVLVLDKTGTVGEPDSLSCYIFNQYLTNWLLKSFSFTHHNPSLLYFFLLTLSCKNSGLTLAFETKDRILVIRHSPIDKKKILNVSVQTLLLRKHCCFPVKRAHGHMWVIPGFHYSWWELIFPNIFIGPGSAITGFHFISMDMRIYPKWLARDWKISPCSIKSWKCMHSEYWSSHEISSQMPVQTCHYSLLHKWHLTVWALMGKLQPH